MKSRKLLSMLLALVLVLSLVACGSNKSGSTDKGGDKKDGGSGEGKKYGVLIFNGSDPYIGTVRQALEELDKNDNTFSLDIQDSQNDQAKQNDQLDALIAKGVDGLLVNVVDFGAGKAVIDKVKAAGIPTVFWNRDITKDITKDDLKQLIFFGTNAPEAGVMQGKIALDKWKANGDLNKDGKLQYVTLHGGLDNAEAVARTVESAKVFTDAGIKAQQLEQQVANWSETEAKTAVDAWLAKYGDKIEVIFANNDGMAIGALQALQQAGYNEVDENGKPKGKYIPVYGVDATESAVEKVNSGELAGTVRQSNTEMAKGIISLIQNKVAGNDWVAGTDYSIFEDGVSVRMGYEPVTAK